MFDVLKINEACKEQHEAVLAKGFEHQPIATNLMLIVSELSEAMEADRHNRHADTEAWNNETPTTIHSIADDAVLYRKPDGHLAALKTGSRAYGFEIKKDFYKDATEKVLKAYTPNLFS